LGWGALGSRAYIADPQTGLGESRNIFYQNTGEIN
jgi:hypothetical protein